MLNFVLSPLVRTLIWLCAGSLAHSVSAAPAAIDTASFEDNIDAIERDGGALDVRLAEHYLSMGLAHRANGDVQEALDAFQQALHVNRINKGLHHLVHIPIVDLLIEGHSELGDWAAVDQYHRFRYWVHRRELDESTHDFVDASLTFAAWQTQAHTLDTGVATFRQLREAIEALLRAEATLAAKNQDGDNPRLVKILNAKAQAYLNLAIYVSNTQEDVATGGARAGDDFGDIIERRNLIIESYIEGKKSLKDVIALAQRNQRDIEHALALANLGDWHLVFDKTQSAFDNYRSAYEQMQNAGLSDAEIALEFGKPKALKRFTTEPRRVNDLEIAQRGTSYVTMGFLVTRTGKVRNLNVLEAEPQDDSGIVRRTRELLRSSRFRPKITSLGPVESSTEIRYKFPSPSI